MKIGNLENPIIIDGTQRVVYDSGEIQALSAATKMLIRGDAIADATGKAVTAEGTAAVTTAQKKFDEVGASIVLDGDSDYLSLADSDDWAFGTGAFTIDFWVRFAADQDSSFYNQYADDSNWFDFKYSASASGFNITHKFGGGFVFSYTCSFEPSLNTWYHIALVKVADANTWYIFVNGESQSLTTVLEGGTVNNIAAVLKIGVGNAGNEFLNGWLSMFRITKGTALWTENFTPPVYADYGGAITNLHITGLDGDVDEEYELIGRFINGYNGATTNSVRLNNDSGSNYGHQYLIGNNTDATASRATGDKINISSCLALGDVGMSVSKLFVKSGYVRTLITKSASGIATTTVNSVVLRGQSWNNTADNITSLNILTNQLNGIGVGSRIILLKKVTETSGLKTGNLEVQGKVYGVWQEIYNTTLTEAATSVTISELTGNTDILYRLRCRFVDDDTTGRYGLKINNDDSTYGFQSLYGSNTTAGAVRDTSEAKMDIGYTNTDGNISMTETYLYAKSGFVRTAISTHIEDVSTTTVTNVCILGQVYDNTADEITSLVISALADKMNIGTNLVLEKLNL